VREKGVQRLCGDEDWGCDGGEVIGTCVIFVWALLFAWVGRRSHESSGGRSSEEERPSERGWWKTRRSKTKTLLILYEKC
jgi:hypothetical protein